MSPRGPQDLHCRRIVLIDDDENDRRLALRALRSCRWPVAVEAACDATVGMRMLAGELPSLVLMDIKMPGLGGLEALERIRSQDRLDQVPIVIFSSSDEVRDRQRAAEVGASAFVVKPVDVLRFSKVVREIVEYWLDREHAGEVPHCQLRRLPA
jgi:CheY-like chemotaxis protein